MPDIEEEEVAYLLLIVEPTGQRRERSEEQGRALYAQMLAFAEDLKSRGVLRMTQSLRTDEQAVRVEVRDGKPLLRDGPFSESKEMVGGFFLLDCDDRADAIAIARQCPAARWACVEVRELGPCFA
jgi:hypothetical protein